MAGIIAGGKYRIAETLYTTEGYSAYKAIDIENRGHNEVLVNRYSGETVRRMLPSLYELKEQSGCGFIGISTENGTVDVLFEYDEGISIRSRYPKHHSPAREIAYPMMESYLHRLLSMSGLPAIFLNAASDPGQVIADEDNRETFPLMLISPDTPDEGERLLSNIEECARLLLKKRLFNFAFELQLLDMLNKKKLDTIAAVYSFWREICAQREAEEPKIIEKSLIPKLTYFVSQRKKWSQSAFESRLSGSDKEITTGV